MKSSWASPITRRIHTQTHTLSKGCDVVDKCAHWSPWFTTCHCAKDYGRKKPKVMRPTWVCLCACVCVCKGKRDVSECTVERLRRVVNVKVVLELMQIKKHWLIPLDPHHHCPPPPPLPPSSGPFTALTQPFASEVQGHTTLPPQPHNSICQNEWENRHLIRPTQPQHAPPTPHPLKKNQTKAKSQLRGGGKTKVPQVDVSVPIYYLLSSVNERAQLLQGGGIILLCWPRFPQIVINHSQSTCHRQAEIQLE